MAAEQQTGVIGQGLERRARPSRMSSMLKGMRKFAQRKPLGAFGAVVLVLLIFVAVFADVLAPYPPNAQNSANTLQAPSLSNPMGTDHFGRDMLSRVIFGARVSIYVGIGASLASVIPAMTIGITSAYFKGTYDYLLQRVVDAIQALPGLILLIAIVALIVYVLYLRTKRKR